MLQRSLGSRAGGDFRVKAQGIRVKPLSAFMEENKPSEPCIYATFSNGATPQPGLVLITGKLLSSIIGCMLGDGDSAGAAYRAKHPITDLELRVAQRVVQDLLAGLNSHWPDPKGERFRLVQVATHGRFITPELREEHAIGATIAISSGEFEFGGLLMTVPLPPNLSPLTGSGGRPGSSRVDPALLRERALDVKVELRAELTRLSMSLGDVAALRPGDVISLGPATSGVLRVEDRTILRGEPGVSQGYRSIRILERVS
jgi:flagellar motor switch protein FliM